MSSGNEPNIRLPRTVKGKRSTFYQDPAIDQLMTIIVELMAEVTSLRERTDTVERILDKKAVVSRDDIEAYVPNAEEEAERSAWAAGFIDRVMRQHD